MIAAPGTPASPRVLVGVPDHSSSVRTWLRRQSPATIQGLCWRAPIRQVELADRYGALTPY